MSSSNAEVPRPRLVALRSEWKPPPITISMDHDRVVIRPDAPLDRDATVALTEALNAAVLAGSTVLVDLGERDRPRRRTDVELCAGRDEVAPVTTTAGGDDSRCPVDVLVAGPGLIRIAASASWWTIDLRRRRFCQSEAPIDRRFVGEDAWTLIRSLRVSPATVSALTASGTLVTSSRRAVVWRPTATTP